MDTDKFSEIKNKPKSFVSFLDENNNIISGYFEVKECGEFVSLQTDKNILKIHSTRILKIKEALQ